MFKTKFLKFMEKKAEKLAEDNERLEKEVEELRREKIDLHEKVETLKVEKKTSEEDIKHMMKKKEEMLDIEFKKIELAVEKEKDKAIAEVKDQYRDKLETYLEKQINDGNKRYEQILERLPNVSMRIKEERK